MVSGTGAVTRLPPLRADEPRTVVVSGASGGVGLGIAVACGRAGWNVWIAARREAEGQAAADAVTAEGGTGFFHRCDIAEDASVAEMMSVIAERSGRLDGIVHNATSGQSPIVVQLDSVGPAEFRDHVRVALRGMFLLARHGQPLLEASSGSLVVLTSEAGFEGKRKLAPYAVIKGAQRGAMRVLAREWGPLGIRVNAVAPLAGTPAMVRAFESDPQMEARVMGRNPLGWLGEPATDIGPVVRFLLGDDARYVTGQTIMADGGSCPIT